MLTVKMVSFSGHETKEWDPKKPGALKEIREFFKEKIAAGFQAFAFDKPGGPGRLIQKFDEAAERVILKAADVKLVQPPGGG